MPITGPGDGAGEEEHGLHGGGAVGALAEAGGDLRQRRGDHAGVELEGQHAEQQGGNEQGGAAAGECLVTSVSLSTAAGGEAVAVAGVFTSNSFVLLAGVLPLGCQLLYNHV